MSQVDGQPSLSVSSSWPVRKVGEEVKRGEGRGERVKGEEVKGGGELLNILTMCP